jgi:hypothetical protein
VLFLTRLFGVTASDAERNLAPEKADMADSLPPRRDFCFSSLNQFSTTLICAGAVPCVLLGLSIRKRWPSGETSSVMLSLFTVISSRSNKQHRLSGKAVLKCPAKEKEKGHTSKVCLRASRNG